MKLVKIFLATAFVSTSLNLGIVYASTAFPAPSTRLDSQDTDTTKNIEHFGYKHKGSLNGAVIDKFTFTPQVVVNILDPRFDANKMAAGNEKPSTKNTKKLLLDIVTKTLHKFAGDTPEQKKVVFLAALQEKGPVEIEVENSLKFVKTSPPTDTMSNTGSTILFEQLRNTRAFTEATARLAARNTALQRAQQIGVAQATATNQALVAASKDFAQKVIALYTDGILTDSAISVEDLTRNPTAAYPAVIESLKKFAILRDELLGEIARLSKEAASSPSKASLNSPTKGSAPSTPTRSPDAKNVLGSPTSVVNSPFSSEK